MPVSSSFTVKLPDGAPSALVDAASRYQAIIRQSARGRGYKTAPGGASLATATVSVGSTATQLSFETDYSYSVQIGSGATIHAPTVFGAMSLLRITICIIQ
jgi:hypothetical protein